MLESSLNPDGADTQCDFVSALWGSSSCGIASALLLFSEEQLVARKHLNAVYPVLDIRYCGLLPIHSNQTTVPSVSLPFRASCFVQVSAVVIDISPDFNSNEPQGQSLQCYMEKTCKVPLNS